MTQNKTHQADVTIDFHSAEVYFLLNDVCHFSDAVDDDEEEEVMKTILLILFSYVT